MTKRLKITLTTTLGLILASIIPLNIINQTKANAAFDLLNLSTDAQTNNMQKNNVQTVANFADIVYTAYSSSNGTNSQFAIVKDSIEGDRLYAWGDNKWGKLGLGHENTPVTVPSPVKIAGFKAGDVINSAFTIDAASAILVNNKDIYTCGNGGSGELGFGVDGDKKISSFKKVPLSLPDGETFIQLAGGTDHFMVSTSTNNIYLWGSNRFFQCASSDRIMPIYSPLLLDNYDNTKQIKKIGGFGSSSWAWNDDNILYVWGWNKFGQFGNGTTGDITANSVPRESNISQFGTITDVFATNETLYAVVDGTKLYGWGQSTSGQFGDPQLGIKTTPFLITSGNAIEILGGNLNNIVYTKDSRAYGLGENTNGQLGISDNISPIEITDILDLAIVAQQKIGFLKTTSMSVYNNEFYAWGDNSQGQYGIGTTSVGENTPTKIDPFSASPSQFTYNDTNSDVIASVALNEIYNNGVLDLDALKKYIGGYDSFPADMDITLKGTPSLIDQNSAIDITLTVKNSYSAPDGARALNQDFHLVIDNFEKITNVNVKKEYPTNRSALSTYDYLTKIPTMGKLEEFVIIGDKHADYDKDFIINQDGLENPIDNTTGTLSFNIVLKNYYDDDGQPQSDSRTFSVSLSGFIKNSSVDQNQSGNMNVAAKTAADSFKPNGVMNLENIKKYINLNFNNDSRVKLVNIGTTVEKDKGSINVKLFLENFYLLGVLKPTFDLALTGFKFDVTSYLKTSSVYTGNQSAQIAFNELVNSSTKVINKTILGNYVDGISSFPSDVQFTTNNESIIDNTNGTINLNIIANKWYDYYEINPNPKSFTLTISGFVKDSSVALKEVYDKTKAAQAVKEEMINANGTFNLDILKQYVNLNFNNDARVEVTAVTGISNNQDGTLALTLTMHNYYKNGVLETSEEVTIIGLNNKIISKLEDKNEIHLISAQSAFDSFMNATTKVIDQTIFGKYVNGLDTLPNNTVLTIKPGYEINTDNNGAIIMVVSANQWYDYSYLSQTEKEFSVTINGFIKNSTISPITGKSFPISPQLAYQSFANAQNDLTDIENLKTYVNLDGMYPGVRISKIMPDYNNKLGTLKLNMQVSNFYIDGIAVATQEMTVTGFIPDSTVALQTNIIKDMAAQTVADSLFNSDKTINETELAKYLTWSFPSSLTKITDLVPSVDKLNGTLTLKISFDNFYKDGAADNTQIFTIDGFITGPTTILDGKTGVFNTLTAQAAFDSFTGDIVGEAFVIDDLDNLKIYVDGLDTVPEDSVLTIAKSSIIDNETGTMQLTIIATKSFDYGYLDESTKNFSVTVSGFITDSVIKAKPNAQNNMSPLEWKNIFTEDKNDPVDREIFIKEYVSFESVSPQVVFDWTAIDIEAQNATGKIIITFNNLSGFYHNGVLSTSVPVEVGGFIPDIQFAPQLGSHFNVSPEIAYNSFANSNGTLKSLTELKKYVNVGELDPRTKIDSFEREFNYDLGTLKLKANFTNAYVNGVLVPSLETTIEGFGKKSTITVKKDVVITVSARQAFASFKDNNGNVVSSEIEKYIETTGSVTIDDVQAINIDDINGSMKIKLLLSRYFTDDGKEPINSIELTINGFARDTIFTANAQKFDISAQEAEKAILEATDKKAAIEKYVHVNENSPAVIPWDNIVVISVSTRGELLIKFTGLTSFYVNGVDKSNYTLLIKGFAINTSVSAKPKAEIYDITATEALNILTVGIIDQEILENYVALEYIPDGAQIKIVSAVKNDVSGTITLDIEVSKYYTNGEEHEEKWTFNNISVQGFKSILSPKASNSFWTYTIGAIAGLALLGLASVTGLIYKNKKITNSVAKE